MSIYDIQESIDELQQAVASLCKVLPAERFGLDQRCGHLLCGPDFIASSAPRLVDYYGGFEYVEAAHIVHIGTWKLYSTDCPRVQAAWEQASDPQ